MGNHTLTLNVGTELYEGPKLVPAPALSSWREELDEALGHLYAAVNQSIPSDDQIIMDHVKAAYEITKIVRRRA